MGLGQFQGDAEAINRRRETTEEQLLLGAREDFVQPRLHYPLTRRVSGPVDVGRILQESQHTAFTVLGKGVQVEGLSIRWRKVNLEVAGMDDYSHRSFNGQGDTVHQAMGHADGLDGESAEMKFLPRGNFNQLRSLEQPMFIQCAFVVCVSLLSRVDRYFQLTQNPR